MSTSDYFQFIIPSRFIYIKPIRLMIGEISKNIGFNTRDIHVIETLIDEACTNAVEHGSPRYSDNKITINVSIDYEKLMIEVIDEGVNGVQHTQQEILNLESKITDINENIGVPRGRGMYLMAKLSDYFEVKPYASKGTSVTIVKYRKNVQETVNG